MNKNLLAAAAAWMVCVVSPGVAQSNADAGSKEELDVLVGRIQEKLRAGEKSAAQLAPEIAAFEALRAKHADSDPATAAKVIQLEYSFFRDVVKDSRKAAELRTLLATKYRSQIKGTRVAQ